MSDNEQAMSSLLLPPHGSFKSQSSTCIPSLDTAKRGPMWLKVTELTRDREESVSRNTEISMAEDMSPKFSREPEGQNIRGSVRKPPLERGASKKTKAKPRLEGLESPKEEQLSPIGRKVIAFVGVSLVFLCMLLVGVTLRLGPIIDEMVRKENEDMYRARTNLPSTAVPVPESSTAGIDNVTTTGHPG